MAIETRIKYNDDGTVEWPRVPAETVSAAQFAVQSFLVRPGSHIDIRFTMGTVTPAVPPQTEDEYSVTATRQLVIQKGTPDWASFWTVTAQDGNETLGHFLRRVVNAAGRQKGYLPAANVSGDAT